MQLRGTLLAAVAILLPTLANAGTVTYYVNTGQTGAQTSINVSATTDWYGPTYGEAGGGGVTAISVSDFDPSFEWLLGGGNFDLKSGPTTTDDITLGLWDLDVNTLAVTEVAWVTWTHDDFCTYNPTCQNFIDPAAYPFYFTDDHTASGTATPYLMQVDHSYLLELTSPAPAGGSTQYFIKSPDVFQIQDQGGNVLGGTTNTPSDAPEPGTLTMFGAGSVLALVGAARRRKSANKSKTPIHSA